MLTYHNFILTARILLFFFWRVKVLTNNFLFDLVPFGFSCRELFIKLKKVKFLFALQIIVNPNIVRDLISLLNQIELLNYTRVRLEFVLPNLEQLFQNILQPF